MLPSRLDSHHPIYLVLPVGVPRLIQGGFPEPGSACSSPSPPQLPWRTRTRRRRDCSGACPGRRGLCRRVRISPIRNNLSGFWLSTPGLSKTQHRARNTPSRAGGKKKKEEEEDISFRPIVAIGSIEIRFRNKWSIRRRLLVVLSSNYSWCDSTQKRELSEARRKRIIGARSRSELFKRNWWFQFKSVNREEREHSC